MNMLPLGWETPQQSRQIGNGIYEAQFGEDSELNVRFVKCPVVNEYETELKGYKVLEYKEFIRISRIGDKFSVYFQEARPKDKARFPRHYEAFISGKSELSGTLLEDWDYSLSETQRLAFRVLGIYYVHQIAAMNEVTRQSLGIDADRIVARAKIDVSEQITKEANSELQMQLDATKRIMEEQQAELDQIKQMLSHKKPADEMEMAVNDPFDEGEAVKLIRRRRVNKQ